jgi:hypothetical protein
MRQYFMIDVLSFNTLHLIPSSFQVGNDPWGLQQIATSWQFAKWMGRFSMPSAPSIIMTYQFFQMIMCVAYTLLR